MDDGTDSQVDGASAGGLADSIAPATESTAPAGGESPQQEPQQEAPNSEIGDNPAWGGVREKLGDALYHSIKDDLSEFDKNAQGRITELNQKVKRFEPYESVLTDEMTPEFAQKAFQMAQWADKDPVSLYESLGNFLRENGRLPQNQEEMAEAVEDDGLEDQEQGESPEVEKLRQDFEKMQSVLQNAAQQQQMRQVADQTYSQLSSEIKELQEAHPYLDKQALGMVIQQAKAHHQNTGKMPALADVAKPILEYRESVLRTPRPNDNAPRLPGSGGGMPSASKPLNQFTKGDDIDAMASLLQGQKKSN